MRLEGRRGEGVRDALTYQRMCEKKRLIVRKKKQRDLIMYAYVCSFSFKYLVMLLKETNKEKYDNANCGGLKTCLHIL